MSSNENSALFRAGDPDYMTSLARGLHVIRAFGGSDRRMTIADVSRSTGLTRAVVRRCLYTLRELGYDGTDGRTFFLQPKILNLGYAYLSTQPMPIAAQPLLEEVSRTLDESCSIGVLDEGGVVFVARSATRRIMSANLRVGSRVPVYCTALGRVLLAQLPVEQLDAQLQDVDFRPHTKHTVGSRRKLDEVLASVRRQGYALNDQELEIGLRSIAVAVRNPVGEVVAAMNVGAQASRVTLRQMVDTFLPVLRSAADRLGEQLPASR
jgi:IclR family pca regulon transcriptional regulator